MQNPAFNNSGTFSYPFTMLKERNRALLKHLDSEDNFKEVNLPFKLLVDEELFMEGEVRIIKSNSDNFQLYLKSGKSSAARILKESYLDETINGQSWGDAAGGLTDINNSPNAVYPTNKFVVAPVQLDDYVINDWDPDTNQLSNPDLFTGQLTPMVYGRHIIDRINQAIGLFVPRNDFSLKTDFNRWCIFSPRKGNDAANGLTSFAEWLPHITAADFLADIQNRFNIIAFFTPLLKEVEYIGFDSILNGAVTDWTRKYISDDDIEAFQKGRMILINDGEDDEILSPQDIENKYDFTEVASYANVDTAANYKVLDVERYFRPEEKDLENDLTQTLYVDNFVSIFATRNLVSEPVDHTTTFQNLNSGAGADNFIGAFLFRQFSKGEIFDNIFLDIIEAKRDTGNSLNLICRVEIINTITSAIEVLGEQSILIDNANYEFYTFDVDLFKTGAWEFIQNDQSNFVAGTILRIAFYSYHPTLTGTLSIRFGLLSPTPPLFPYTYIIPDRTKIYPKEINPISNIDFGDTDAEKVEEIEPDGKVLFNTTGLSGGYHFQMPKSDIDPELKQADFAHTIYRGKITDERDGTYRAPYCNFDVVDLYMADYQSRLTIGSAPDLSLRWHGATGLAETFWRHRLIWFRNYHRPVRKRLALSLHDIIKLKMYHRYRIDNVTYILNEVGFKIDVNGDISTAEVEMFTV